MVPGAAAGKAVAEVEPWDLQDPSLRIPFGYAAPERSSPRRIAIILHLFYDVLAAEFALYLANIPGQADLYISTDTQAKQAAISAAFRDWTKGVVEIRLVPNRGRDIAPKLVAFRDIYPRYDYVLQLHSKVSPHDVGLASWRRFILDHLVGSETIVRNVFEIFERNPSVGMIAPQHFDYVRLWLDWRGNFAAAQELASRFSVQLDPVRPIDFPSGSMFWCRPDALRPLLDLQLVFEDFATERGQQDGTLAHTVERLFFHACEAAGYRWTKLSRPEFASNNSPALLVDSPEALQRALAEQWRWRTGGARHLGAASDESSFDGPRSGGDATARVQSFFRDHGGREGWPWRHWNAHPRVARAINRRISGSAERSLFQELATRLPALGLKLPAGRAVSLGCGRGRQDRSLYRHGILRSLVGYDLSPDSIEAAARWAKSSGITSFDYRFGDLNSLDLPPHAFDLVIAEMSLHHTTELEQLFDVAARALKPGGLLIADEYVGPTRFQWTEAQMRTVNGLLATLPEEMRRTPDGIGKPAIERQPESFFDAVDPSESVRSGDVMTALESRFEIVWKRPYGGAVLHPLLHDISWNFREGDRYAEAFLDAAISVEETMMAAGTLESDFVALIARPR